MQFYTVEEIARIFKVSRRTVLRLIYSGKIKAIKIGNRWRIKKEEVKKIACIGTNYCLFPEIEENERNDKTDQDVCWVEIKKEELNQDHPISFTCVDLFSGAGGLSLGFEMGGFRTIASVEVYKEAVQTYKYNFPSTKVFDDDIRKQETKSKLASYVESTLKGKELDALIGGPPCQGFSLAGLRLVEDPRNNLYRDFLEVARMLRPKVIVMENVEGLRSFLKGKVEEKILDDMKAIGYNPSITVLNSAWYGVPQTRKRVIIIANRLGVPNLYPSPVYSEDEYRTVRDAIEDLMDIPEKKEFNHVFTRHKPEMKMALEKLKEGESLYPNYSDSWKKPFWNKPAPTVKENHGAVHVHPKLPRVMTPRELARLQSFPDSFIFKGAKKHQLVQIGNAVPPLMAKAIALSVRKMIERQEELREKNSGLVVQGR